MNSREILVAPILLGALGPGLNRVEGEQITWEFSGQITFVSDPNDFLGGAVGVGSLFSGTYTFESTTPDSDPDPTLGIYNDAVSSVTGQVGGVPFGGPVNGGTSVLVGNNAFAPPEDSYHAGAAVDVLGETLGLTIYLIDDTATAFSSDSLPLSPPPLGLFDIARLEMISEPVPVQLIGDLALLVPEPGTLALLGLGGLVARNRRHRARLGPK